MKRQIRIHSQNKEETRATHEAELARENVREFSTPEEMLRHDSLHTPVPPTLAHRLHDSVGESSPAKQLSWWRKILGLGP